MGWIMLLVSLPLAFLMGLAAQKGNICAVSAMAEVLDGKRPRHLFAILACSLWVLAATVPLAWMVPRQTLAVSLPITGPLILGAVLFGIGATINGGCAFSTLTRCAVGDIARAATVAGMVLGLLAVGTLPRLAEGVPALDRPSPFAEPSPWAMALVAAIALAGAALLSRLARRRAWRDAWRRPRWDPFAATAVIGLTGGTVYAIHGPWMYTSLLPRALGQPVSPDIVPAWEVVVLLLVVMAGAALGAELVGKRRFRLDPAQVVRSTAGGILMGAGGSLTPGGNDVLVLHTMPAGALHGAVAYVAMMLAILGALALKRAVRSRRAAGDSPARPG